MARLSTGLRINKAADDASGLAIADVFHAQALGIGQAIQNGTDATSLVQIADGALEESTNILNTIRTKAVQAASEVDRPQETRRLIQNDIDRLLAQLDNIAQNTSFNGQKLLSGAFSNKAFQIGASANQTVNVSIGSPESTRVGHISTADLSLTSADGGDVQLEITSSITGPEADSKHNDSRRRYNPVNTEFSGLSFRKHLCNNTPSPKRCAVFLSGEPWRLLHPEGVSISLLMPSFARFAVVLLPSQITA